MAERRDPMLYVSLWSIVEGLHPVEAYDAICDRIHLDVMSEDYCGTDLFLDLDPDAVLGASTLMLDAHLMLPDPAGWIVDCPYADRLASVSVHLDGRSRVEHCLDLLRARGIRTGVAVRLDDPWDDVAALVPEVDQVVVMGTPIGVKGVPLQEAALETIERLVALRRETGSDVVVIADGGIRADTIGRLASAGADALAVGSLLCRSPEAPATFWRNRGPVPGTTGGRTREVAG